MRHDPLDSVRERGHEREAFSRHRMGEGEFRRVKRHPVQGFDQVLRHANGRSSIDPPSIGSITEEWMPHRRQVNSDLVGTACFQPALEKRDTFEPLEYTETRHRALAPPFPGNRHANP